MADRRSDPHPVTQATVIAYTDGACSGNPGPGAWAYRLEWPDGSVDEATGAEHVTTNNREELKAVREALRAIRARIGDNLSWVIIVRTDSMGAINWLTRQWKRNKNLDLFPTIDPLLDGRVRFEHVSGHSGDAGNQRVDDLAVAAIRTLSPTYKVDISEKRGLKNMTEHQWTPEELQSLAALGLSITPHSDPAHGWGYTWQGRDWSGPFTTPDAAIHSAFTEALQALLFRSEYSWVLFAQPGERWQFNSEGWVHVDD